MTQSMNNNPLVSIITVCYNSEKNISQAIESVLKQTYSNLEYIIIDGKSSDSTVEIAQSYTEKFAVKNIRYTIISEKDNGIYDAMNKGIKRSDGQIIGMVNSDDWYEPDIVNKVVSEYIKTNFEMLFGDVRMHRLNGKTLVKKSRLSRWITSRSWNHPTTFIARTIYNEMLYACENIYDDLDMYMRLRKEKRNIVVLNETLANFRMGGLSNKNNSLNLSERIKLRYKLYRKNGYSRVYLLECLFVEGAKYILT